VGLRAAELAAVPEVLEVTMSRDHVRSLIDAAADLGIVPDGEWPDFDDPDLVFGVPASAITTTVDVTPWLDRKRKAMEAHASQIIDMGPFFAMPDDVFAAALGIEFYIRHGVEPGHRDHDVFRPEGSRR
jgi:hypothetical protein